MERRLIDASKVNATDAFGGMSDFAQDCRNAVVELLNAQPTIDPVHAAGACYCRECKWKPKCLHHKEENGGIFGDNDFCSYGEPREEARP